VLDAANWQCFQEVIAILLYYVCAMDSTLLTALGTLATQQAKGTHAMMMALTQILNYCANYPDATICYHASDMVLWTHSNASYLTTPKGHSCTTGYCFMSSTPVTPPY